MAMFLQREGLDEKYPLDEEKDTIVIGRSVRCDLHFSSPHISRQHCEITRLKPNGTLIIKNLKETNVTYVENYELRKPTDCVELRSGSVIGLGVPLNEERTNRNFVFLRLCQESTATPPSPIDQQGGHQQIPAPLQHERISSSSAQQGGSQNRQHNPLHSNVEQRVDSSLQDIARESSPSLRIQHRKTRDKRTVSQEGNISPSILRTPESKADIPELLVLDDDSLSTDVNPSSSRDVNLQPSILKRQNAQTNLVPQVLSPSKDTSLEKTHFFHETWTKSNETPEEKPDRMLLRGVTNQNLAKQILKISDQPKVHVLQNDETNIVKQVRVAANDHIEREHSPPQSLEGARQERQSNSHQEYSEQKGVREPCLNSTQDRTESGGPSSRMLVESFVANGIQDQPGVTKQGALKISQGSYGFTPHVYPNEGDSHQSLGDDCVVLDVHSKLTLSKTNISLTKHIVFDGPEENSKVEPQQVEQSCVILHNQTSKTSSHGSLYGSVHIGPVPKKLDQVVEDIDSDDAVSLSSIDLTQPDPETKEEGSSLTKGGVACGVEKEINSDMVLNEGRKVVGKRKRVTGDSDEGSGKRHEQNKNDLKKTRVVEQKNQLQISDSEESSDNDSIFNHNHSGKKVTPLILQKLPQLMPGNPLCSNVSKPTLRQDRYKVKVDPRQTKVQCKKKLILPPRSEDIVPSDSDDNTAKDQSRTKKKRRRRIVLDSENDSISDADIPQMGLTTTENDLVNKKCTVPLDRVSPDIMKAAKKGKAIIVNEKHEVQLLSPTEIKKNELEKESSDDNNFALFDDSDELPDLSAPRITRHSSPSSKLKACEKDRVKVNAQAKKKDSVPSPTGPHKQSQQQSKESKGQENPLEENEVQGRIFKKNLRIEKRSKSKERPEKNLRNLDEREMISSGENETDKAKSVEMISSGENETDKAKSVPIQKNVHQKEASGSEKGIFKAMVKIECDVLRRMSTDEKAAHGNRDSKGQREKSLVSFPSKSSCENLPRQNLKRKNEMDFNQIKIKKEKTDHDEDKCNLVNQVNIKKKNTDGDEGKCKPVEDIEPFVPMVVVKKEPEDEGATAPTKGSWEDDDDDEVNIIYSQVDETIWVSSDEEESPSQENASFGPRAPSPDLDIAQLFEEHNYDKGNEEDNKTIELDLDSNINQDDEDDDQWFPVLSQAFWDDDDLMKPKEKEKKEEPKASVLDAVAGPSGVNLMPSSSSNTNTGAWWPELSQNFFDDEDEEDFSSVEGTKAKPTAEKSLDSVIEKLKNRDTRKAQLIDPKVPLPPSKNYVLKKRGRSRSDTSLAKPRKSSDKVPSDDKKGRSRSKTCDTTDVKSKQSVPRKSKSGSKRCSNIRENLSNKFKLDSYKALARQQSKDKHHLHSSPQSSDHKKPEPPKKSHLISDEPRKDENISIQKKEIKSQSNPKVAAKFTRKTRAEKLTEVNLFPSPVTQPTKAKKSTYSIPKKTAAGSTAAEVGKTGGTGSKQSEHQSHSPLASPVSRPVLSSISAESNEIRNLRQKEKTKTNEGASTSSQPKKLNEVKSSGEAEHKGASEVVDNPLPKDDDKENQKDEAQLSKGILKTGGTKSLKKKVHFPVKYDDLTKIKYISPRKNSDKRGSLEAKAKEVLPKGLVLDKHNIPCNFPDHFIYDVCRWNYDWLETYRVMQDKIESNVNVRSVQPPPVVKNTNYPTLILYDSYNDYKEIFSNLLYLEVWEHVYKDWVKYRLTNMWFPTIIDVIQPSFIESRHAPPLKSWRVKLITLVSQDVSSKGLHPRQGSLIALRVSDAEGKKKQHFFAYVEHFVKHKKRLMVKELEQACPQGEVCILLEVRVAKDPVLDLKPGQMISISNISYIRPFTRTWEGLCMLPLSPLCSEILSPNEDCFIPNHLPDYLVPDMPLNDCQKKAVSQVGGKCVFDCQIPKMSLIHGPPGTGKTRTIIALIAQIIRLSEESRMPYCRVLLCAPSNAAADELTLRLMKLREIKFPVRVVRVGIKESISKEVRSCTLETFVAKQMNEELKTPKNKSAKKEWERRKIMVNQALEGLAKAKKENKSKEVIKSMEVRRDELARSLSEFEKSFSTNPSPQEYHALQQKWQKKILLGAQVITTTLGGCCSSVMTEVFNQVGHPFSCCIIDEAGQCKETEIWLPLLFGVRKLVMVGDHRQLPATVLSQIAQDKNLKQSLFERLYHRFVVELQKDNLVHTLDVQYRMHPDIVQWPSQHFYFNKLKTCQDIVQHRTHDLKPYVILDMKNSQEQRGPNNELFNMREVFTVRMLLESLEQQIVNLKIGVVTPYQKQRFFLERELAQLSSRLQIVINTIDGFQGQERDIIILSFVRANSAAQIGFLAERQRLNVALTRARKSCFILASASSLMQNKDWHSLITDATARKVIHSVSDAAIRDKEYFKCVLRR